METLEPQARHQLVARAFEHAFSKHKEAFSRVLKSYVDKTAPKNKQSLLATNLGICRSLFLAAKYSDRDDLFQKIDEVRLFARKTIAEFEAADIEGDAMTCSLNRN
jgi:hypothetical protein